MLKAKSYRKKMKNKMKVKKNKSYNNLQIIQKGGFKKKNFTTSKVYQSIIKKRVLKEEELIIKYPNLFYLNEGNNQLNWFTTASSFIKKLKQNPAYPPIDHLLNIIELTTKAKDSRIGPQKAFDPPKIKSLEYFNLLPTKENFINRSKRKGREGMTEQQATLEQKRFSILCWNNRTNIKNSGLGVWGKNLAHIFHNLGWLMSYEEKLLMVLYFVNDIVDAFENNKKELKVIIPAKQNEKEITIKCKYEKITKKKYGAIYTDLNQLVTTRNKAAEAAAAKAAAKSEDERRQKEQTDSPPKPMVDNFMKQAADAAIEKAADEPEDQGDSSTDEASDDELSKTSSDFVDLEFKEEEVGEQIRLPSSGETKKKEDEKRPAEKVPKIKTPEVTQEKKKKEKVPIARDAVPVIEGRPAGRVAEEVKTIDERVRRLAEQKEKEDKLKEIRSNQKKQAAWKRKQKEKTQKDSAKRLESSVNRQKDSDKMPSVPPLPPHPSPKEDEKSAIAAADSPPRGPPRGPPPRGPPPRGPPPAAAAAAAKVAARPLSGPGGIPLKNPPVPPGPPPAKKAEQEAATADAAKKAEQEAADADAAAKKVEQEAAAADAPPPLPPKPFITSALEARQSIIATNSKHNYPDAPSSVTPPPPPPPAADADAPPPLPPKPFITSALEARQSIIATNSKHNYPDAPSSVAPPPAAADSPPPLPLPPPAAAASASADTFPTSGSSKSDSPIEAVSNDSINTFMKGDWLSSEDDSRNFKEVVEKILNEFDSSPDSRKQLLMKDLKKSKQFLEAAQKNQ